MEIELLELAGFKTAFHGMRNAFQTNAESDSKFGNITDKDIELTTYRYTKDDGPEMYASTYACLEACARKTNALIGPRDMKLAQKLIRGGTDESKFMRQIYISFDLTAPLFYWKELDTYKVGTVANSESTMHTLTKFPITRDNFNFAYCTLTEEEIQKTVDYLENLRKKCVLGGEKEDWRSLVEILPSAWLQRRTISMNYAVLRNIYFARRHHRLIEWHEFCDFIEGLPYGLDLICLED